MTSSRRQGRTMRQRRGVPEPELGDARRAERRRGPRVCAERPSRPQVLPHHRPCAAQCSMPSQSLLDSSFLLL